MPDPEIRHMHHWREEGRGQRRGKRKTKNTEAF